MNDKKTTKPEVTLPKKRKKKRKQKIIISKELSSETKFKNTEKQININSFDSNDNNKIVIYKTGTKYNESTSIIKRLKMNKCCTYFGCICESKRKNIENVLLKE